MRYPTIALVGNIADGYHAFGPYFDSEDMHAEHQDDEYFGMELHYESINYKWTNPLIQFARLIEEMSHYFDDAYRETMMGHLEVSMDLSREEILMVFDAAQEIFDNSKANMEDED